MQQWQKEDWRLNELTRRSWAQDKCCEKNINRPIKCLVSLKTLHGLCGVTRQIDWGIVDGLVASGPYPNTRFRGGSERYRRDLQMRTSENSHRLCWRISMTSYDFFLIHENSSTLKNNVMKTSGRLVKDKARKIVQKQFPEKCVQGSFDLPWSTWPRQGGGSIRWWHQMSIVFGSMDGIGLVGVRSKGTFTLKEKKILHLTLVNLLSGLFV